MLSIPAVFLPPVSCGFLEPRGVLDGISGERGGERKKGRKKERKEDGTHLLLESCFLVVVTTSPPITRNIAICRFINPSIREAYELTNEKRISEEWTIDGAEGKGNDEFIPRALIEQ